MLNKKTLYLEKIERFFKGVMLWLCLFSGVLCVNLCALCG